MTSPADVTVAYLGPAGTFTQQALLDLADQGAFGARAVAELPVGSPREALDAVRNGEADFAVVASENSVAGAVTTTSDALVEADLATSTGVQIYAEHDLHISFAVMVRPGTSLSDAARISCHPVAFAQVRGWVEKNAPHATFVPASSNAAAAESVAKGEADVAVAPKRAAEIFGLDVVACDVADVGGASTRFVAVGRPGTPTPRTGRDRTTVVFTLPNEPGSLVRALMQFATRGVDMTRIESRPTREGLGTYRFHVEVEGHVDDADVAAALRAIEGDAERLEFLGSYPVAGSSGVAGGFGVAK